MPLNKAFVVLIYDTLGDDLYLQSAHFHWNLHEAVLGASRKAPMSGASNFMEVIMKNITRCRVSTYKDEELKSILRELFNQLSLNPPRSAAYQQALASIETIRCELKSRMLP